MLSASQGLLRPRSRLDSYLGSRERVSIILQHVDRTLVLCPAHRCQGPFSAAVAAVAFAHCCLSRRTPFSTLTGTPQSLRQDLGGQPGKRVLLLKVNPGTLPCLRLTSL